MAEGGSEHPTIQYYVVDAFSKVACQGNPAAVVILPMDVEGNTIIDEGMMQRLAMEIHLSETAFVWQKSGCQETVYVVRYFTPTQEIELCGHATMATAKVLFDVEGCNDTRAASLHFETYFGETLSCTYRDGRIAMRFPSDGVLRNVGHLSGDNAMLFEKALGTTTALRDAGAGHGIDAIYAGRYDFMVVLKDCRIVQNLQVDMNAIKTLTSDRGMRGVIVTASADPDEYPGVDFVSRFFGPGAGIPEDPVTGSAHCTLGPYWQRALGKTTGSMLVGKQIGPMRQGIVRVQSIDEQTVEISGDAVIVSKTTLYPSIFTSVE